MAKIRVGISGWDYDDWRGAFYPDDLPRHDELRHATRVSDTIEINGSFYSLKRPDDYRRWYEAAPRGFRFAVKGGRFITHQKRLKDVDTALANFFASGVLELKDKLGPFLWQLPASFRFDASRLEPFLEKLPRDTAAASRLARRHDDRVRGRASVRADKNRRIRHVLEPRHASFFALEAVRIVRRYGVAFAFSPSANWDHTEEVTAGFVYVRLHGPGETYRSCYSASELDAWAERVRMWHAGAQPHDRARFTRREPPSRRQRDVYVYFDNDHRAYAPRNALELRARLAGAPLPGALRPPRVPRRPP